VDIGIDNGYWRKQFGILKENDAGILGERCWILEESDAGYWEKRCGILGKNKIRITGNYRLFKTAMSSKLGR
jgi:hypothetical protein